MSARPTMPTVPTAPDHRWLECSRALKLLDERLRDLAQRRELLVQRVLNGEPGSRSAIVASLRAEIELRDAARELALRVEMLVEDGAP